jgi:uncharacterized protein YpbB
MTNRSCCFWQKLGVDRLGLVRQFLGGTNPGYTNQLISTTEKLSVWIFLRETIMCITYLGVSTENYTSTTYAYYQV